MNLRNALQEPASGLRDSLLDLYMLFSFATERLKPHCDRGSVPVATFWTYREDYLPHLRLVFPANPFCSALKCRDMPVPTLPAPPGLPSYREFLPAACEFGGGNTSDSIDRFFLDIHDEENGKKAKECSRPRNEKASDSQP